MVPSPASNKCSKARWIEHTGAPGLWWLKQQHDTATQVSVPYQACPVWPRSHEGRQWFEAEHPLEFFAAVGFAVGLAVGLAVAVAVAVAVGVGGGAGGRAGGGVCGGV